MVDAALVKYMPSVEGYRERLASLQGSWDTLSLLSHLSGDGTDMSSTRQAFEVLAAELVKSLGAETYRKSLLTLKAKGQIAIDVLVRNLYERTADIGFLCTDRQIRDFLHEHRASQDGSSPAEIERLRRRLREYAAKYSVYSDVILLSPDGTVLLRMDDRQQCQRSTDPLITETMNTRAGYVETFRRVDLLPQQARSLVYSFRVVDGAKVAGILCLCFRFEDEVSSIFAKLRETTDWTVFALLDAQGTVIASSDRWQLPQGAPLTLALEESGRVIRFAGREYLAMTRPTQGYQGYKGPGWYGHVMIPLEHAFEGYTRDSLANVAPAALADLRESEVIFSTDLRKIPTQADQIQRELNRAVWNGNVRLAARADGNTNFSKVLLWEIGNAGRRTQDTFQGSISDLQETVLVAILEEAQLLASLAVEVLDRNLYERANDCRWWALDGTLQSQLESSERDAEQITAVLRHIHSLYTVYHDIIVFDSERRIVAVSNPAHRSRVGQVCTEEWAAKTLRLRTSQEFAAAQFAPSALYGNRHALIFGAAVRNDAQRVLGGVGIVFDTTPQLNSMLHDALPRDESGKVNESSIGVFVDREMRVLAATSHYKTGDIADLPQELLTERADGRSRLIVVQNRYYAVGCARTTGYREYPGMGVYALVLVPLGSVAQSKAVVRRNTKQQLHRRASGQEQVVDIATFHCAQQWLGLLRDQVVEAVDGSQLRTSQDTPIWHAGLLMYRGQPIPVIDLARLMGADSNTRGRDVIVARSATSEQLIGLLIDDLADIPEVPASRILAVTELAQRAGPAIMDRAVRPDRPEDPVLFLVNVEQLMMQIAPPRPSTVPAAKAKAPAAR